MKDVLELKKMSPAKLMELSDKQLKEKVAKLAMKEKPQWLRDSK